MSLTKKQCREILLQYSEGYAERDVLMAEEYALLRRVTNPLCDYSLNALEKVVCEELISRNAINTYTGVDGCIYKISDLGLEDIRIYKLIQLCKSKTEKREDFELWFII